MPQSVCGATRNWPCSGRAGDGQRRVAVDVERVRRATGVVDEPVFGQAERDGAHPQQVVVKVTNLAGELLAQAFQRRALRRPHVGGEPVLVGRRVAGAEVPADREALLQVGAGGVGHLAVEGVGLTALRDPAPAADRGGVPRLPRGRQREEPARLVADAVAQAGRDAVVLDQQEPRLLERLVHPAGEALALSRGPVPPQRDIQQRDVWRGHDSSQYQPVSSRQPGQPRQRRRATATT